MGEHLPVKLGDVAEIVMGQSPSSETCNRDGIGDPLLNGPTEFGPHHPSPIQFTTDPRKHSNPGDLLFCVRGSTGRMNWSDRRYAIGRGIAAIRHKENRLMQPFIRSVIEYNLPNLLQVATGSVFSNVSARQLAQIPYPCIEEKEKEAVAAFFGALDDKIDLNRRMNETLEAMARAFFRDWFVDF
ncbi:MAG: restriction endonuclease subunit S, partial [Hyphomonadaceae bacterium]|nr:restriction endonuclease subunit S [Hyphomonadaceae bacterium]